MIYNAFSPSLVLSKNQIIIAYEYWNGNNYKIRLSLLTSKENFKNPIEIDFNNYNCNRPKLICKDKTFLVFEKSRSLQSNDTWRADPNDELITIPSFGHGWRIKSGINLFEIELNDNALNVYELSNKNDFDSVIKTEDAGECNAFFYNDNLYLLFLEYDGLITYKCILIYFNKNKWERIDLNITTRDRKCPAFYVKNDLLITMTEDENHMYKIEKTNLSNIKCSFPEFKKYSAEKKQNIPIDKKERELFDFNGYILNLYWGDLHMHSNISLCSRNKFFHCTNVEEKHKFSRYVGKLDFCLLTDHENMSDVDWARTKKSANFWNYDNKFVSFLGFEWTSSCLEKYHNYGHYNVLYKKDGKLYRIHDGSCFDIKQLWSHLKSKNAMTIPHHPSDGIHPLDLNYFNEKLVRLIEIFQVRGAYEKDNGVFNPNDLGRTTVKGNSITDALFRDYRFGFTAGGEHEGVGITGVYAKELTRKAIFEALYNRRTIASSGWRLFFTFFVNDTFIGGELYNSEEFLNVSGKIISEQKINSLWCVTNKGEINITASINEEDNYNYEISSEDLKWVYMRAECIDKNVAWTSPIFINQK